MIALEPSCLSHFLLVRTRLEIVEKGPSSSLIRSTVEYEFDDGRPELDGAASTAPLAAAAVRLVQYVNEHKSLARAYTHCAL
uniref:Bet v I/Major latex protein domain-containing protein n=1 Tax=Arundo donax TaxID=35708 RepID=A0A0A9C814_ARUDO